MGNFDTQIPKTKKYNMKKAKINSGKVEKKEKFSLIKLLGMMMAVLVAGGVIIFVSLFGINREGVDEDKIPDQFNTEIENGPAFNWDYGGGDIEVDGSSRMGLRFGVTEAVNALEIQINYDRDIVEIVDNQVYSDEFEVIKSFNDDGVFVTLTYDSMYSEYDSEDSEILYFDVRGLGVGEASFGVDCGSTQVARDINQVYECSSDVVASFEIVNADDSSNNSGDGNDTETDTDTDTDANNDADRESNNNSSSSESGCNDVDIDYPKNLRAESGQGGGEVTLRWERVTHADYYRVEYGQDWNNLSHSKNNVGDVDSYAVTGLTSGEGYYFKVKAINGCKTSDYASAQDGTRGVAQRAAWSSSDYGTGGTNTSYSDNSSSTTTSSNPTTTYNWESQSTSTSTTNTDTSDTSGPPSSSKGAVKDVILDDEGFSYTKKKPKSSTSTEEGVAKAEEPTVDGQPEMPDPKKEKSDVSGQVLVGDWFETIVPYLPWAGLGLLLVLGAVIVMSVKKKNQEFDDMENSLK